jgi:hypothetical protein
MLGDRFKHLYFCNHSESDTRSYKLFSHNDQYCHPPPPPDTDLSFSTSCMCRLHSVFMLTAFLLKLEFGITEFRCYMQYV